MSDGTSRSAGSGEPEAGSGSAALPPITSAIPVRLRDRFDPRPGVRRVRNSTLPIAQIVVAATAAYAFAYFVVGHQTPLLAGTVTVASLGLVRDARPRRVLETVVGMVLGILIAEILLLVAGRGWWQVGLALAMTLAVARFLSPQASFAIAAAIQSLIVLIVPASTNVPFSRMLDGVIGGVAALLATALIPRSPRGEARRDVATLFRAFDGAVMSLAIALRTGDRARAERGLEKARALDPLVRAWRETLDSSVAIARISPWLWASRAELARAERVLAAMDLATRNLRVVARRTAYLVDDRVPRPVAADLVLSLGRGAALVEQSLADISLEPVAQEALLGIAHHLDPTEVVPGAGFGDQNLIAALRPFVVDLLIGAGLPPQDARRAIPRI